MDFETVKNYLENLPKSINIIVTSNSNSELKYKNSNKIGPNFFLLNFNKCKISADKVGKKLEDFGIILREMKSYGIKNCLRFTIGNKKENIFFINKMKSIFKNV